MGNNLTGKLGSAKINIVENVIPDWNQNDPNAKDYVKNRPGGYDTPSTVDISWDGDMTGKETVDGGGGFYLVKIADEAPPIESFAVTNAARAARKISKPEYAAIIECGIAYDDGTIDSYANTVEIEVDTSGEYYVTHNGDGFAVGVLADSVVINGMTVAKGLWLSFLREGAISNG